MQGVRAVGVGMREADRSRPSDATEQPNAEREAHDAPAAAPPDKAGSYEAEHEVQRAGGKAQQQKQARAVLQVNELLGCHGGDFMLAPGDSPVGSRPPARLGLS